MHLHQYKNIWRTTGFSALTATKLLSFPRALRSRGDLNNWALNQNPKVGGQGEYVGEHALQYFQSQLLFLLLQLLEGNTEMGTEFKRMFLMDVFSEGSIRTGNYLLPHKKCTYYFSIQMMRGHQCEKCFYSLGTHQQNIYIDYYTEPSVILHASSFRSVKLPRKL